MGFVRKIQCDGPGCAAMKQEANHWLAIRPTVNQNETFLVVTRLDYCANLAPEMLTFCGLPCALRKLHDILEPLTK